MTRGEDGFRAISGLLGFSTKQNNSNNYIYIFYQTWKKKDRVKHFNPFYGWGVAGGSLEAPLQAASSGLQWPASSPGGSSAGFIFGNQDCVCVTVILVHFPGLVLNEVQGFYKKSALPWLVWTSCPVCPAGVMMESGPRGSAKSPLRCSEVWSAQSRAWHLHLLIKVTFIFTMTAVRDVWEHGWSPRSPATCQTLPLEWALLSTVVRAPEWTHCPYWPWIRGKCQDRWDRGESLRPCEGPSGPFSVCWGLFLICSSGTQSWVSTWSGLECPRIWKWREFLLLVWLRLAAPEPRQQRDETGASSWVPGHPSEGPAPRESHWVYLPPPSFHWPLPHSLILPWLLDPSVSHPGPRCTIRCSCPQVPVENSSKSTPLPTSCCHRGARRCVWLAA